MSQRIDGYFLTFTKSEEKVLREFFDEEEIAFDSEGIKNFLLSCAAEVDEEEKTNIEKIIEENPELVNFGLRTVKGIFGAMKKGRG